MPEKYPENERECLRRKELENNPIGSLSVGIKKTQFGSPADLVG